MMRKASPLLLFLLLASGCAGRSGQPYIPRIGSVSELDSKAYDALLITEAVINKARESSGEGTLPAFMKPIINTLIDVHNTTRAAWLGYRGAAGAENEAEEAEALSELLLSMDKILTRIFSGG